MNTDATRSDSPRTAQNTEIKQLRAENADLKKEISALSALELLRTNNEHEFRIKIMRYERRVNALKKKLKH